MENPLHPWIPVIKNTWVLRKFLSQDTCIFVRKRDYESFYTNYLELKLMWMKIKQITVYANTHTHKVRNHFSLTQKVIIRKQERPTVLPGSSSTPLQRTTHNQASWQVHHPPLPCNPTANTQTKNKLHHHKHFTHHTLIQDKGSYRKSGNFRWQKVIVLIKLYEN